MKNIYYEKYKTFRAKTFQLLNHVDQYLDELKTLMVDKILNRENFSIKCAKKNLSWITIC